MLMNYYGFFHLSYFTSQQFMRTPMESVESLGRKAGVEESQPRSPRANKEIFLSQLEGLDSEESPALYTFLSKW